MENKYCLKFVSGDGLIDNPDLVTVKVEPDDEVISSVENCFGYSATRSLKQEDTSEDKSYHDSLWNGSNTINDFGLSSDLQHSIVRPVDPDCDKYPMTIAECSQDSKEEVQQLISNGRNDFTTGISTSNFDFCLKTEVKVEDDLEGAGEPSEDYEDAEHFMDNTGNIWDREEGGLLEENVDDGHKEEDVIQGSSCEERVIIINNSSSETTRRKNQCYLCAYSTDQKCHLMRHISSVHMKIRPYKCTFCDYSGSNRSRLEEHIDSAHLNIKKHKCRLCDFNTTLQSPLTRHYVAIHLVVKEVGSQSHTCYFSSNFKLDLQQYVDKIHWKLSHHKCDLYDYTSTRRGTLK